jgi:hypothetical protein
MQDPKSDKIDQITFLYRNHLLLEYTRLHTHTNTLVNLSTGRPARTFSLLLDREAFKTDFIVVNDLDPLLL